jgi:hypothetical protein
MLLGNNAIALLFTKDFGNDQFIIPQVDPLHAIRTCGSS